MALTLDRRTATGSTSGSVELDESIFGIQPNVPVLHQVVTAQLAAARAGTQSTKTRAEVSGGGKKPFKQKGTGRARQGSERAPHFTGGGVAFGPKPRSYRQKTPKKMIQLALRSALSDRASEGKIVVVEPWPWREPRTRDAKEALVALGIEGRVLVVLARHDGEAYKSFRNLTDVQVILNEELNAYDILCNETIVFTTETLPGSGGSSGSSAGTAEGGAVVDDSVTASASEYSSDSAEDSSDSAEDTDTAADAADDTAADAADDTAADAADDTEEEEAGE